MSSTIAFDIIARDRASDKFDKVGDSATRSSGKLKKWAAAGALAVAGGAVIAGKALFDMTKGAIEDEAAQKTLAKALQNSTGATKNQVGAVESWITAQGKALGVADDELRPALGKLARATGDVSKAQKLTSLAMDISAGSGKSLSSVTEALMKAQNGSLGGLSRLGVATKNAAGEEKSLKQITKELADLHGGQAAAAADTNEGKMRRLKLMYDEAKESIGSKLLPIVGKMADWFMTKAVPAIGKVGDWMQQKLMPPLRDFAEKAAPKAREIMDALQGAFKDASPFIELMGKVLTNVVVPGLKKLLDVAGPVLVNQIKTMGKTLEALGKAGVWMWNNALQPVFKFLARGVATVLDGFGSMLSAMGKVPGFGWAKDAAVAMGKAAEKARAVADGLNKIKDKKVTVTVVYAYQGKRNPGKETQMDFNPRGQIPSTQSALAQYYAAVADGIKKGGKKVDAVLEASRTRMKDALGKVRDDMKSMSQSIAAALTPDSFSFSDIMQVIDEATGAVTTHAQSALQQSSASLLATNSALTSLMSVFATLKGKASKGFLASLMQSGNTALMQQYAADPNAIVRDSALYDQNAAMATSLGDQTAQAVMGDKIDAALTREMKKLVDELKDQPGKTAKKLREEIKELRLVVEGLSAGQKAHLKGGW